MRFWTVLVLQFLLLMFLPTPGYAAASTAVLRLSPTSGTRSLQETFTVDLLVDTGGQEIIGVQAEIAYSSNLQLLSTTAASSVFEEEVLPPSNTNPILFSRVRLSDGFSGNAGHVLQMTFKQIDVGIATISITQNASEVLAFSDVTNILQSVGGATFTGPSGTASSTAPHTEQATVTPQATMSPSITAATSSVAPVVHAVPDIPPTRCSVVTYAEGEPLPNAFGKLRLQVPTGERVVFSDVPTNAWYARYVGSVIRSKLASGYKNADGTYSGRFGPESNVTYAEIAKMLLNLAGEDVSSEVDPPENLSARHDWSAPYIRRAEEKGITVYRVLPQVTRPATRGAVIQAALEALGVQPNVHASITFTDVPSSHQHRLAIATAASLGIVSGDTDASGKPLQRFRPDATINRAEVSKILVKLAEAVCK